MDLFTSLFLLLFALTILISAASEMVESSIYIAKKLNIPKAIIGATILAYGTSSPEILVSLQANLNNEASIALGNVIGSNIANVCISWKMFNSLPNRAIFINIHPKISGTGSKHAVSLGNVSEKILL